MSQLRLHNQLLDRQVQDLAGTLIGKVDDIELSAEFSADEAPHVTAILLGPQALGDRIGGRLGRLVTRAAHWLGLSEELIRVPFDLVAEIGSAVVLSVRAELLADGHRGRASRVGDLIGRPARDRTGRALGRVAEIIAERASDGSAVVTEVVVVPRGGLRMTSAEVCGPWLVRVAANAWRGKTLILPWREAHLD